MRFNIVVVVLCVYVTQSYSHKRAKRIINGLPLVSHDLYNTHFVVELVETFACMSEQLDHKLNDCEHGHKCGGALIRPDFVLTACHCLVYEIWYSEEYYRPLPSIPELGPRDIPYWIDDRVRAKPLEAFAVNIGRTQTKHPLLNAMTIWAGNANKRSAPQKRHAAAFFPHHLCAERQTKEFPKLWKRNFYEMDIGLVKTCEDFSVNKDVRLAPMIEYDNVEKYLSMFVKRSYVCLYVGWGASLVPGSQFYPEEKQHYQFPAVLQHTFRSFDCHSDCYGEPRSVCMICAHHFGPDISHTKSGDSGSPVICDGLYAAVIALGWTEYDFNYTASIETSLGCVKDHITDSHLAYLRSTQNEAFHWLSGHPVVPKARSHSLRNLHL